MNAIATLPPSVYAAEPSPKMSERYVHVSTAQVIELMKGEGFTVEGVMGVKPRDLANVYGKHVIDFRHPDVPRIGDSAPRFLFGNSHDGSTRAWAMAGVFRFVCSNGMVVGSTYAKERVRRAAHDIIERMRQLAKNTAPLFQQIESWQRKELSAPQRLEFARLAATLRFGDPYRFDPAELLLPRREEDDAGNLWAVFNRVQEATTKGGMVGLSATGRQATARPLNEVTANVRFNEQLWQLAEEFSGL